ncbi:hypothetical protein R1flu_020953 [Riccia fluitans]|uniref:Uncharacterized protein n=1 Tax=Riccia fluitans TaxID=41844 RepID=A0ABD1ZNB2_9MARC
MAVKLTGINATGMIHWKHFGKVWDTKCLIFCDKVLEASESLRKSGGIYTVQSGQEKGLVSRGGLPDCTLDLNTEGGGGREAICRCGLEARVGPGAALLGVGQLVWKFAGSVFFTVSSRLSSDGERAIAGGNEN